MTNDDRGSTDSESSETESAKYFHNASAFSNSRGSSPGTCSPGTYSGFSEIDSSTSPENLQRRRRSNSAPLMPSLPPSVDGMMSNGSTWTPQSPFSSRYFAGSLPPKDTTQSSVPSSPNNIECWQTDTTTGSTGSAQTPNSNMVLYHRHCQPIPNSNLFPISNLSPNFTCSPILTLSGIPRTANVPR